MKPNLGNGFVGFSYRSTPAYIKSRVFALKSVNQAVIRVYHDAATPSRVEL
ncbi:hypothetical protein LYNGBM3L_23020 [Moorena producens 3L]|uniref:Uncharacterized protein n=1 Tax=Moorena producens 3L TaxID=489825 RepID=F4XMX7_9CYAN|nr:hypothetical protein LYNGBM3L_23020 [Moorena producens 3L]